MALSSYRVYASTLSSIENLPYANLDKELHIVLVFARDFSAGARTSGKFEAYFDKTTLTPDAIQAVKDKSNFTSVKFFLSIGGRSVNFPFAVTPSEQSTWIRTATDSLKEIIKNFKLDGIDVYYEHISTEPQFVKSIFDVVSNLKKNNIISKASITVPARLNNKYYELFRQNDRLFDSVVYQTHTETSRLSNFQDLKPIFDGLLYPKDSIFAGHSDIPSDWANVPPPTFLGAVPQLLNDNINGISKWIVNPKDYDPEA